MKNILNLLIQKNILKKLINHFHKEGLAFLDGDTIVSKEQ